MLNFLSDWLNPQRRRTTDPKRVRYERKLLRFESLETRQLLSVNLGTIQNIDVPGTKTVLVPLTSVDSNNGAVSYTFSSSNPSVQLSLLSQGSKSLKIHVQASNGATFSGDLVFKLFEDLTPVTTARIEDLVSQGYYNGLDFFRIVDGFVAQGGRAGNPTTQQLDDEFNSSLTFTSRGLLAMANAGDDTGAAEFFITAIDAKGSTNPITLNGNPPAVPGMPQHLNFQHTIFGQLVSGFDLFEQIMTVPTINQGSPPNEEQSDPVPQITITSAQIITDTQDAVLKVVAPSGFSGASTITVTAHGSGGQTAQQNFTATAVADQPQQPDPPFLNDAVPDKVVPVGQTVEFTMSSTNISGGDIYYDGIFQNDAADSGKATLTVDHVMGHVTITPTAGFIGTVTFLVGVQGRSNGKATSDFDSETFSVTWVTPTLNAVSDQKTAAGVQTLVGLTESHGFTDGVVLKIVDPTTFDAPTNVTVSINQATGQATISPNPGITGAVNLRAAVRPESSPDVQASYTTQDFTLTVVGLNAVGDKTTATGVAVPTFTLTTTPTSSGLVFNVVDANTLLSPANVTVNVTSDGHVTLTPAAGFSGTVALRARMRIAGTADVAANYTTQDFTLTVLAPTLDPVGDSTILTGKSTPRTLNATNPAGGGLFYDIVDANTLQPPANLTIAFGQNANETTLTPTAAGVYHLLARVRANDAANVAANYTTQAFTLTAVGLAPVSNKATVNGVAASFTLTKIPADADVAFSIVDATTLQAPANVTVDIDQSTGQSTLTPTTGFSGSVNLLARVRLTNSTDLPENYTTQAFSLSSAALSSVADLTTGLGAPVTFTLASIPAGANVFFKIVDPTNFGLPAHVTATINQATGQVTLKPNAGFTGTINLRAAMRGADSADVEANYTTDDFTLTVVAPTLAEVSNKTVAKGVPSSFTLSATNPTGGSLVYNIVDSTTLQAPANVTVNINQATGAVTLTSSVVGTYNLRARVRATGSDDVASNYTTQDFMFTVVAPTLEAVSNQTIVKGATSSFTLTATNPAGGTLIYNIVDANTLTAPANVTININQGTGQVTLTPTVAGIFNLLARVRATGSDDIAANYTTQSFTLTAVGLGAVSNKTTQKDVATSFALTTIPAGSDVIFSIVDPTTLLAPANVTVAINQTNGQVTLTPAAGFTGTINLLARLRLTGSDDVPASYTTQAFTLTVTENPPDAPTNPAVDASSYTGPFDGNSYVSTDTIKLTVNATTGTTVKFKLGGVVIATATETAQGSGVFTATLAAGKLAVGANVITATATNVVGEGDPSAPLSVTYAPDYADGVYVVPGAPGTPQSLTFDWTVSNAGYKNEVGYFIADSADGSIGDIAPGEAGYAQAALNSSTRHVIFAKGQKAGASDTLDLVGGQVVVFYIIQNNTTANFLAKNPSNTLQDNNQANAPMAFFSVEAANPDGKGHTQTIADPTTGRVQYNWEDLVGLGDSDFNDVVITIRLASQSVNPPALLRSPGAASTVVTLNGDFHSGKRIAPLGDVGVFFVDDPDGTIDGVHPGDPGYLAKALESGNFKVLIGAGSGSAQGITVPAGKYLAFYLITDGTTADFLTANPSNSTNGGPVALLSFDAANPSGTNHFRWYTPGTQATDPNIVQLHAMDKVSGGEGDFDSFTINLSFSSQSSS